MSSEVTKHLPFRSLWALFRRFFSTTRPDRWQLMVVCLLTIGTIIGNTVMIWLLGAPFDLLQQGNFAAMGSILAWFVALILLNYIMTFAMSVLSGWIGLRYIGRLRNSLFSRVLALSYPVAGWFGKGDLLARLSNDVNKAEELAIELPLAFITNSLTLVFYSVMLFWIDTQLALIALAFTPLLIIHQRYFSPRKRHISQQYYGENGKLLAFEEDTLGNLRGVSSFGVESLVSRMQMRAYDSFQHWGMRDRWLSVIFSTSFGLFIYLPAAAIVFIGVKDIQSGLITVSHLVSFMLYLGYLSVPVRGLVQIPFQSQGAVAACERLVEILDSTPMVQERADAKTLLVENGDIAINHLQFSYPDGNTVFNGISLEIKAGETVALVGPSGSGKSTLARLLMRFYDPATGAIQIDGVDLHEVTLESLRKNISVVWQDPFLINGTIRANLLMACPDANESKLMEACQSSQSWQFIQALPQGLDTVIGAGGVDLSSGQRQRLALAQAFLHDAPILILDEASSALDSQTEEQLVQSVESLRQGRTTLIIAHRFSSIRSADRIIYFNGNGTVSAGSHTQLLENHPGYQQAVTWQTATTATG